jgi:hypothetical protein
MRAIEGRFPEAARLFQRTLELDPGHPEARALLDKLAAATAGRH